MLRKPGRPNKRHSNYYTDFRREVLKRDKYKCQMPGCKSRRRLQVHHIIRYADSVRGRLNSDNGIALCRACHDSIKDNEGHYVKLFMTIVQQNNANNKRH